MVHRRRAPDDAGVVDEHVEAAGHLHDFGDEFGGALLGELAEIFSQRGAFGAEGSGLGGGFRLVADVHAHGMGAFAREREGDGLSNAASGAGDDGYFACETFCFHNFLLLCGSAGRVSARPKTFFRQGVAMLRLPGNHFKSAGFTASMSSNVWFSPAMPQMNL